MKKTHKRVLFSFLFLILIVWFWFSVSFDASILIHYFGEKYAYLVIFIAALITGGSSVTAAVLYPVLITFVQGGLSLILVSVLAAVGSSVSDFFFMFFGNQGRSSLSERNEKHIIKALHFISKYPKLTPLGIFLYAAFMPLPNDLMTITLGASGYSIKKAILPILLGNSVFFMILISIGLRVF
jgi:membrane protein YqaA with SNARE-associated domain